MAAPAVDMLDSTAFVQKLYLRLLKRDDAPDLDEMSQWANNIDSSGSIHRTVCDIAETGFKVLLRDSNDDEIKESCQHLCDSLLGRVPGPGEVDVWADTWRKDGKDAAIRVFLNSAELKELTDDNKMRWRTKREYQYKGEVASLSLGCIELKTEADCYVSADSNMGEAPRTNEKDYKTEERIVLMQNDNGTVSFLYDMAHEKAKFYLRAEVTWEKVRKVLVDQPKRGVMSQFKLIVPLQNNEYHGKIRTCYDTWLQAGPERMTHTTDETAPGTTFHIRQRTGELDSGFWDSVANFLGFVSVKVDNDGKIDVTVRQ